MPHIWRTSYKADIMCQDPSIEQVLTWGAKAHVACHQVCVVFLQYLALGKSLLHMWTIPPPLMPQSPRRSPGSRKVLKPLLIRWLAMFSIIFEHFQKKTHKQRAKVSESFHRLNIENVLILWHLPNKVTNTYSHKVQKLFFLLWQTCFHKPSSITKQTNMA